MKKFRKILSFTLAMATTVLAFSGCSTGKKPVTGTTSGDTSMISDKVITPTGTMSRKSTS